MKETMENSKIRKTPGFAGIKRNIKIRRTKYPEGNSNSFRKNYRYKNNTAGMENIYNDTNI